MITDEQLEVVANALRAECVKIFGTAWNYDNAKRFAKAALEAVFAMQEEEGRYCNCLDRTPLYGKAVGHETIMICSSCNKTAPDYKIRQYEDALFAEAQAYKEYLKKVEPEDNQDWIPTYRKQVKFHDLPPETIIEIKCDDGDVQCIIATAISNLRSDNVTWKDATHYRIKPNTVKPVCECKDIKPGGIIKITNIRNPQCAYCGDKIIPVKPEKKTLLEFYQKKYPNPNDGFDTGGATYWLLQVISEYLEGR